MKFRRLLAVFFCLILALNLGATAFAAKDDVGDWEVAAKAAILIDPDTDEVLYARNIHEKLYPASLTKVMTALLVLEEVETGRLSLDQIVTASTAVVVIGIKRVCYLEVKRRVVVVGIISKEFAVCQVISDFIYRNRLKLNSFGCTECCGEFSAEAADRRGLSVKNLFNRAVISCEHRSLSGLYCGLYIVRAVLVVKVAHIAGRTADIPIYFKRIIIIAYSYT